MARIHVQTQEVKGPALSGVNSDGRIWLSKSGDWSEGDFLGIESNFVDCAVTADGPVIGLSNSGDLYQWDASTSQWQKIIDYNES